jgi:phosphoribosylglycinamide formyltransferase-1
MGLTRIVVMISGEGTNLQSLIDAIDAGVLPDCTISHVFSNKSGVGGLTRATNANIRSTIVEWDKTKETREV